MDSDEFDDDYVARLLAEDAKKTSQKYSSQGLSAFLPKRRAVDAPKPNTRFLSHIVREADSHNAALKRKEETEARRRLKELYEHDERPRKRVRTDETADSKRNRLFKDIVSAANSERKSKPRQHESSDHGHIRQSSAKHSNRSKYEEREGHSRSSREKRRRSSTSLDDRDRNRTENPGRDSRRYARKRCEHEGGKEDIVGDRSGLDSINLAGKPSEQGQEEHVRKRGRGAYKLTSGIDSRFEQGYDPSQDMSLDSDGDDAGQDWDMALEAMRDRAKWKRNQANRLRAAGFDETGIERWERGTLQQNERELTLKDVRWARKGDIREWDAGKVSQ